MKNEIFIDGFYENMKTLLGSLKRLERKAQTEQIARCAAMWGADTPAEAMGILQAASIEIYRMNKKKLHKKSRKSGHKTHVRNADLRNTCKN